MRHRWTEEEKLIVRRDYKGNRESLNSLAQRLGVTLCAVKGQIPKMGLGKIVVNHWTPEQDKLLAELITRYAPLTVARKLGRSENSVVVRAKRLHLSCRARDGWYTKSDVCQILGVDHKWLRRYIDNGWLKATYHHGHKPQKTGSAACHIAEADLRDFIRQHSFELNGRRVDVMVLVDILGG